jgi:hypothetical protein
MGCCRGFDPSSSIASTKTAGCRADKGDSRDHDTGWIFERAREQFAIEDAGRLRVEFVQALTEQRVEFRVSFAAERGGWLLGGWALHPPMLQ